MVKRLLTEIVKWPEKRRNAEGRIIEIIGDKDEVGADIIMAKTHFQRTLTGAMVWQAFLFMGSRKSNWVEQEPEDGYNGQFEDAGPR